MKIENRIHHISEILLSKTPESSSDLTLMNGDCGKALFLANYAKASGCDKSKSKALKVAELIRLNEGNRNLRLSDGLSGAIWTLHEIESLFHLDLGAKDQARRLENALIDHTQILQTTDQLDYLHGFLGVEHLLSSLGFQHLSHCIDQSVILQAQIHEKGVFWFECLGEKEVINLGLAHGQAAFICYLADRLPHCKEACKTRFCELLESAVNFLLSTQLEGEHAQFPSYLIGDESPKPSRLAWCYGDLGTGIALLRAGRSLKKPEWVETAIKILKSTVGRKNENSSGVQDLGFCHGSSGLCQLYDYLERSADISEFAESKTYWLNYTLKRLLLKDNTYQAYRGQDEQWVESMGLLDGLAGIGLVLINQVFPELSNWEEVFYLKPIRDGKIKTPPPIDHSLAESADGSAV